MNAYKFFAVILAVFLLFSSSASASERVSLFPSRALLKNHKYKRSLVSVSTGVYGVPGVATLGAGVYGTATQKIAGVYGIYGK